VEIFERKRKEEEEKKKKEEARRLQMLQMRRKRLMLQQKKEREDKERVSNSSKTEPSAADKALYEKVKKLPAHLRKKYAHLLKKFETNAGVDEGKKEGEEKKREEAEKKRKEEERGDDKSISSPSSSSSSSSSPSSSSSSSSVNDNVVSIGQVRSEFISTLSQLLPSLQSHLLSHNHNCSHVFMHILCSICETLHTILKEMEEEREEIIKNKIITNPQDEPMLSSTYNNHSASYLSALCLLVAAVSPIRFELIRRSMKRVRISVSDGESKQDASSFKKDTMSEHKSIDKTAPSFFATIVGELYNNIDNPLSPRIVDLDIVHNIHDNCTFASDSSSSDAQLKRSNISKDKLRASAFCLFSFLSIISGLPYHEKLRVFLSLPIVTSNLSLSVVIPSCLALSLNHLASPNLTAFITQYLAEICIDFDQPHQHTYIDKYQTIRKKIGRWRSLDYNRLVVKERLCPSTFESFFLLCCPLWLLPRHVTPLTLPSSSSSLPPRMPIYLSTLTSELVKEVFSLTHSPRGLPSLFLSAEGKASMLSKMYSGSGEDKVGAFIAKGFKTAKRRRIGVKNAFALFSKGDFVTACAFFLFSWDPNSIVSVCSKMGILHKMMVFMAFDIWERSEVGFQWMEANSQEKGIHSGCELHSLREKIVKQICPTENVLNIALSVSYNTAVSMKKMCNDLYVPTYDDLHCRYALEQTKSLFSSIMHFESPSSDSDGDEGRSDSVSALFSDDYSCPNESSSFMKNSNNTDGSNRGLSNVWICLCSLILARDREKNKKSIDGNVFKSLSSLISCLFSFFFPILHGTDNITSNGFIDTLSSSSCFDPFNSSSFSLYSPKITQSVFSHHEPSIESQGIFDDFSAPVNPLALNGGQLSEEMQMEAKKLEEEEKKKKEKINVEIQKYIDLQYSSSAQYCLGHVKLVQLSVTFLHDLEMKKKKKRETLTKGCRPTIDDLSCEMKKDESLIPNPPSDASLFSLSIPSPRSPRSPRKDPFTSSRSYIVSNDGDGTNSARKSSKYIWKYLGKVGICMRDKCEEEADLSLNDSECILAFESPFSSFSIDAFSFLKMLVDSLNPLHFQSLSFCLLNIMEDTKSFLSQDLKIEIILSLIYLLGLSEHITLNPVTIKRHQMHLLLALSTIPLSFLTLPAGLSCLILHHTLKTSFSLSLLSLLRAFRSSVDSFETISPFVSLHNYCPTLFSLYANLYLGTMLTNPLTLSSSGKDHHSLAGFKSLPSSSSSSSSLSSRSISPSGSESDLSGNFLHSLHHSRKQSFYSLQQSGVKNGSIIRSRSASISSSLLSTMEMKGVPSTFIDFLKSRGVDMDEIEHRSVAEGMTKSSSGGSSFGSAVEKENGKSFDSQTALQQHKTVLTLL
ncbi:hypothetical protein ADUPG1_010296, partial [Aduncisulcus paluster]